MKEIYKTYDDLPLNLTVMQTADVLGISRASAYELIHKDGFPRIKIGDGRYIIPKYAFFKWISDNTKTTDGDTAYDG